MDVYAIPITQKAVGAFPNLLPYFLTFNSDTNFAAWTTASGSGVVGADVQRFYFGDRSMYLASGDNTEDFEVNSGGEQTRQTALQTGQYYLTFSARLPSSAPETGDVAFIRIARNGVANWRKIIMKAEDFGGITGKWVDFFVDFPLSTGQYIDFSFGLCASDWDEPYINFDALANYLNDRDMSALPAYTEPYKAIPSAANLDNGDYLLKVQTQYNSWQPIPEE